MMATDEEHGEPVTQMYREALYRVKTIDNLFRFTALVPMSWREKIVDDGGASSPLIDEPGATIGRRDASRRTTI